MSTRSQLRFMQRVEQTSETEGDADRVAQVYRHSDEYPASVLQDLVRLKELLDATLADRGPGYTAAAFVFLDKHSTVSLYLDGDPERTIDAAQPACLLEPSNMEHLDQPLFLLGHASKIQLTASTATRNTSTSWNSRRRTRSTSRPSGSQSERSLHIPRWDGPTDEAFERASWQFHGSLEDALTEPVRDEAVVK